LQGKGRPGGCVSTANNALYYGWQGAIYELDLETLEERELWNEASSPRPMRIRGRANPTADGRYVCVMLMEDQPEDKPAISFSYSRFREYFHLKPLTQIARIEVATGKTEIIHEDRRYMGHVNTSPAQPDILTYCHEGPWNWIDAHEAWDARCGRCARRRVTI
jgi:oligogalacturonide lyase